MVRSAGFILIIMKSCSSVLSRRVTNSDLCFLNGSFWLLCREWIVGEEWQEWKKKKVWLAVVALVHLEGGPEDVGWGISGGDGED